MPDLFELTTTYVVAGNTTARTVEGGERFWKALAEGGDTFAAAESGWLISSHRLTESWPNWEMHPHGDEIVLCRTGRCELLLELPGGPVHHSMTPGKTIVIEKGTWHTVQVTEEAELLHITSGKGTTFKPAGPSVAGAPGTGGPRGQDARAPTRVVAYASGTALDDSRAFYTDVLGLEAAMEDPVLGLTSPANRSAQVIIPPAGFEDPQPQFGIDLGDPHAVEAAHIAAINRGLRVVYPLRDEPWGVRRFFVEDPGGTIINVLAHTNQPSATEPRRDTDGADPAGRDPVRGG